MAYVYRHIRLDNNEPFYIGIGSDNDYKRAYKKTQRTKHWKSVSDKGYEVEILIDGLTWEEACEKDKEFILLYGRKDLGTGNLINLTEGGEGTVGRVVTNKTREILKEIFTGRKRPDLKGKKRVISEEQKQKTSNTLKGRKLSEQTKDKMRGFKRLPMSEETKRKISEYRKGKSNGQTGLKRSEETKIKMSESQKTQIAQKKLKKNN
jgi:hypothetical protein